MAQQVKDLVLLQLWHTQVAAVAQIWSLACEISYAMDVLPPPKKKDLKIVPRDCSWGREIEHKDQHICLKTCQINAIAYLKYIEKKQKEWLL